MRVITAVIANPTFGRFSGLVARLPLVGRPWKSLVNNPKRIERFVKFAIVGTIGAAVDFTVLNIMTLVFENTGFAEGWHTSMGTREIQLAVANAIGFCAAVLSNFTWNRLWTFPESRDRHLGTQLLKFATVNVTGLLINTVIVVGLGQYVLEPIFPERLSYNIAKAIAILIVLFWNFGMNLIWTFRGID
jgi:putative flippase GtrA